MEDKEIIKDFGEYKVPVRWEDITLKQYMDIERYYNSVSGDSKFDIRDVLHILTNKSMDEINELPMAFTEKILEKLSFLMDKPEEKEPSNKITIDGEDYIINFQNKLKTGEYIAADTIIKDDPHNYAAILAILCRKDGEIYDSKFENEVIEDRIKLFEEQPVMNIFPLIAFFINCYMILEIPTLLSTEIKEGISLMRRDIESSHQNGEISKRSMKSAMKKLKKLEKSINSI